MMITKEDFSKMQDLAEFCKKKGVKIVFREDGTYAFDLLERSTLPLNIQG